MSYTLIPMSFDELDKNLTVKLPLLGLGYNANSSKSKSSFANG